MSDQEFFELVAACREELADKQARFWQRIADADGWSYQIDNCLLTIGDERFSAIPIGTHSPEYGTWLWAWANDEFPTTVQHASSQVQELHEVTGFQVFLDRGLPASAADAEDLAALAIHQLGAMALFRAPPAFNGPTMYMAVQDRLA